MALFKTDYFIYHKEGYEPIVLEEGFHWPAFFFSFLWAFQNKMWLQGSIGLIAYILAGSIFLTEVIQFANFIGSYFNSIEIGVLIVMLIPNFIYGSIGIEVFKNKLTSEGYHIIKTVKARTRKSAVILAKNLKEEEEDEEEFKEVIIENKECPMCAESVKARAKICRFCSYEFE